MMVGKEELGVDGGEGWRSPNLSEESDDLLVDRSEIGGTENRFGAFEKGAEINAPGIVHFFRGTVFCKAEDQFVSFRFGERVVVDQRMDLLPDRVVVGDWVVCRGWGLVCQFSPVTSDSAGHDLF